MTAPQPGDRVRVEFVPADQALQAEPILVFTLEDADDDCSHKGCTADPRWQIETVEDAWDHTGPGVVLWACDRHVVSALHDLTDGRTA
jgi:hypothetical protein